MSKRQQNTPKTHQIVKCGMCLRPFIVPLPHVGRIPVFCPECATRRRNEQIRQNMARAREKKRELAHTV